MDDERFADPFGPEGDPELDDATQDDDLPERPIERFRRSATGAVVSAGLLGLRNALEGRPEREQAAVVQEAPTRPLSDRIEVHIDFEHPEQSIAVVRPREPRTAADEPEATPGNGAP